MESLLMLCALSSPRLACLPPIGSSGTGRTRPPGSASGGGRAGSQDFSPGRVRAALHPGVTLQLTGERATILHTTGCPKPEIPLGGQLQQPLTMGRDPCLGHRSPRVSVRFGGTNTPSPRTDRSGAGKISELPVEDCMAPYACHFILTLLQKLQSTANSRAKPITNPHNPLSNKP